MFARLILRARRGAAAGAMDGSAAVGLPGWEMAAYLCLTVGSHLYSFYEVHRVSHSKSPLLLPPRPKA